MKLITFLYELSDVLSIMTDVERVLLTPSPNSCKIEFMARGQTSMYRDNIYCVAYANTNEAVEDLPQTVGIMSIQTIHATLKSPGMDRKNASAKIKFALRLPKLEVNDHMGNFYEICLFHEELAKQEIKIPNFKARPIYEVETTPTATGIALFKHWAAEMGKFNKISWIVPYTNVANQLIFSYRDGQDRAEFVFANNISSSFAADWRFRDKGLLQLLKIFHTSKSMVFKFFTKGLLTVELQTTYVTYLFHFPASKA